MAQKKSAGAVAPKPRGRPSKKRKHDHVPQDSTDSQPEAVPAEAVPAEGFFEEVVPDPVAVAPEPAQPVAPFSPNYCINDYDDPPEDDSGKFSL